MRKFMSLLLAAILVMSLATVAFAAEGYTDSEATSFSITKEYTSDVDWIPGETLNFTVTPDLDNPDPDKTLIVGTDNTYTINDTEETSFKIPVAVPQFSTVGEYKFTITETPGSTAGVAYNTEDAVIKVLILVAYDNENDKLVIDNTVGEDGVMYWIEKTNGEKIDTFTNTYTTDGFTVDKNVEGNMANETDVFEVTVKLTAPTDGTEVLDGTPYTLGGQQYVWGDENNGVHTINVSEDGDAVTIDDLPAGVNVEIVEVETNDVTNKGYADQGYTQNGYTVDGTASDAANIVVGTNDTVVVENYKGTTVETGVITDSAPYIILITVCAVAAVLFVIKRRAVAF